MESLIPNYNQESAGIKFVMIHLLVTLDQRYIPILRVMLASILHTTPDTSFTLYLACSSLTPDDFEEVARGFDEARLILQPITVCDDALANAPIEDRYPKEMYYRLFAAKFLPQTLDRVLYLDPDIVVLNDLREFYKLDLGSYFFAAASHVKRSFQALNNLRLDMPNGSAYVNSGVMLMNLAALRQEQNTQDVFDYIAENKAKMLLPDQDVLNALYHDRILHLNPLLYNLSEKYYRHYNLSPKNPPIDVDWVRRHTVFMHYCGRNKPWKPHYRGKLDIFYHEAEEMLPK